MEPTPPVNQVETNSFNPRQRQLWGQAFSDGLTITAGQMWSLLTTDRKGIATRAEFVPMTIDGACGIGGSPEGANSVVLTSVRYYLP